MSQAVKVGIFGTLGLLLLGYFILRIEDWNPFDTGGRVVDAAFASVAGLNDRAPVRVAGVRVGQVDGIELRGRDAVVHLRLDQDVGLTTEARARIASLGMLGDKYVDLTPGPVDGEPLPEGAVIPGEAAPGFDDAMARLDEVATSVVNLTEPLAGGITGTGPDTPLSRLIENLEATSAQIRMLVEANREQVGATVANFQSLSATLDRELPRLAEQLTTLLADIQGVVAENRDELSASAENIATLTEGLKASVDDINRISGRLADGEGSLGKLLTSDELHDELVTTLDSVQGGVEGLSDTLGRVRHLRLDVDMEGWALADRDDSFGRVGLTFIPHEGSQRLYRLGLASTPIGEETVRTRTITETLPDGTTERRVIETVTVEDEPVLSALVGYRTDSDLHLWTGLIEDDFGVQVEYPLFDRRFWLDFQAFNFDRERDLDPHLRLSGRWYLNDNLYLVGGYDDPLVDEFDSLFVGGGIRWTDDDLKYLLGQVPTGGL